MKTIKTFLVGAIIGLLVGLWFGYNLGKGRDFYANPFADESVQKQIKEGREAVGEGVERVGEEIKGKIDSQK